jgi:hypothetical protein
VRQGYERRLERERKDKAGWMAMLLNSQYVNGDITPEQLLGEELPGDDLKQDLEAMQKLLAARGAGSRSITPGDLITTAKSTSADAKKADLKLTELLAARKARR